MHSYIPAKVLEMRLLIGSQVRLAEHFFLPLPGIRVCFAIQFLIQRPATPHTRRSMTQATVLPTPARKRSPVTSFASLYKVSSSTRRLDKSAIHNPMIIFSYSFVFCRSGNLYRPIDYNATPNLHLPPNSK